MRKDIIDNAVDAVVIPACSPRDHEKTFMNVLSAAGINPYMMQMVNIREQIAWVTEDPEKAAAKAVSYINAAISRVNLQEPLEKKEIDISPDAVIVGAGPAGLKAALSLAEAGRKVTEGLKNNVSVFLFYGVFYIFGIDFIRYVRTAITKINSRPHNIRPYYLIYLIYFGKGVRFHFLHTKQID